MRLPAVLLRLVVLSVLAAAPARAQSWVFESAQTIPSSDTPWGGIALEPGGGRLFIARNADGLLVWDVRTRAAHTVADSKGVVTVVMAPGRAYAVTTEGVALAVDLATLKVVGRTELGGDVGFALFDPGQNRVHFVSGPRPEKSSWISLDATSGEVVGRAELNSRALAASTVGPDGDLFALLRDRAQLQLLDPRDLSVHKSWRLGDCQQPAAMMWEPASRRALIACRGDKPVFVALDPAAGVVSTVPIGRGADGLGFDPERRLVVIANGTDGTISVIRQDGPNEYASVETTTTRPGARALAMDPGSRRLFSVAATVTTPSAESKPPYVHPDSFVILTFRVP